MKAPSPVQDATLLQEKGPGEVWAVFAGTLGQNYDVETLLRASALLGERAPQVKIVIAGEGPLLPRVRQFVRDHASHNVIYIGKIPPETLPGLYAKCDIGLCAYRPGSTVALPDKAHDYMAAGLPMVSSLKGELERLLQTRRIGIQYAAGDARSLAASLELLAGDGSLRRQLAENSYECAAQFDRRIQYSQFVAVVEKTRGKRVPKPPAQEAARQVESNGCADLQSACGAPDGVRRACPEDIPEIVAIHVESFPGFFLSFLGPRFLRVLYESIVDHERGAAFVYLDNGEVAAFVAGVTDPSAFYRALIKHRLPAFMWAAMSAALRRPQIILRLFRALLYPSQTPRGDAIATLMSIGTRPKCQGRGIGRQLVEAFLAEMNRRGVRCVNLTTDRQNNDEVNAFYRKLGFTLVRTYGTPEHRQMNEYEYVLGRR
jgi:ribosomal protein S18 acetylase RimI-like enzyme